MRRDIQDALASVGEVAIFVWSLLELLFTRILPLAGFLAGQLLLQLGCLLAAAVIPAAGRREPRAEYSYDVQAEEDIEEDNVLPQLGKKDDDHENEVGSLKSTGFLEEISPSLTHEEAATIADDTAELLDQKVYVAESVPSDGQVTDSGAAANEVQVRGSDYGNVAEEPANEVQVRGNVDGHVAETEPLDGGEDGHVSSKGEGSAGKMDLEPSDVQEATSTSTSEEAMSPSRRGGEKSRRMQVLPPSFSQIRRTLMQRSRRASASPHTMTPSPIKKKPHRKLAIKPSSSYDNFMGKFRKHFLLDSS